MLIVDSKSLLARLSRSCLKALEQSVVKCVDAKQYEVTVEHLIVALLDDADSDFAFLATFLELDLGRLRKVLTSSLSILRAGNTGRPTFSAVMLEWMQDAGTVGTFQYGFPRIRSGVLFLLLVAYTTKYAPILSDVLKVVDKDELKAHLPKVLSGSKEEAETSPPKAPAEPAAAAPAPRREVNMCGDLIASARAGQLSPVVGREQDFRRVAGVLARSRRNSVVLVGARGVGRRSIVYGLVQLVADGRAPPPLRDARILTLDEGLLRAGATTPMTLESRIVNVFVELMRPAEPAVLCMDAARLFAEGALGRIVPVIAAGKVRVMAVMSPDEHAACMASDPDLSACFEAVEVREPTEEVAVAMLRALRPKLEEAHGVRAADEAVRAAVELSAKHLPGPLPGKAVNVLDASLAHVELSRHWQPLAVENAEAASRDLARERDALRGDRDLGLAVDDARLAEVDAGIAALASELATLREGPTPPPPTYVDRSVVASVVAAWAGAKP